ncbi:hypothetical protein EYF80_045042 [Liparis tanakae]|uniref:Uncharacterized protein n=1 Tax=Liparis tanakae TaxID=230148 RepID=A0A4Z2FWN3_9TELE|nr:hypothetical protein EYF80_045042 [Liparis tanakae]
MNRMDLHNTRQQILQILENSALRVFVRRRQKGCRLISNEFDRNPMSIDRLLLRLHPSGPSKPQLKGDAHLRSERTPASN